MRLLKKSWVCYLFVLPMLIYVLIFSYLPMYGIQLAFKDYRVTDGIWGSAWVGLKHFKTFFESYQSLFQQRFHTSYIKDYSRWKIHEQFHFPSFVLFYSRQLLYHSFVTQNY